MAHGSIGLVGGWTVFGKVGGLMFEGWLMWHIVQLVWLVVDGLLV